MHTSGISQDIPVFGWAHFENELAEEATWASHSYPCHMHFASDHQEGSTFTPRKLPEEQRSQASLNPTTYQPVHEMKMMAQECHKLHEPKINKLNNGNWPL